MSSRKPKKSEKKSPVRAATRYKMSTKEINELSDEYHRKYPAALYNDACYCTECRKAVGKRVRAGFCN